MPNFRKKIIKGSIWVIVMFFASQLLRLAGNLIATRLLVPEMFGVMTVIYVIIHGLSMFSDVGLWAFIVKSKNGLDEHYLNTAWTIQIIRGWVIYILLLLFAFVLWYVPTFTDSNFKGVYNHPQLPILIAVSGLASIFAGYQTMAPAILSRDLLRGKLEAIDFISQIFGTGVMLVWAWLAPSIWALASAFIISYGSKTILTNIMFHHRHKFEINHEAYTEIINFGKWIVLASIFTFASSQGDKLLFAYYLTATELGIYSIAFFLAMALTQLVQSLSSKILFPLLSHVANNAKSTLKKVYYQARFKLDLVVGIIGGFLIASGDVLIQILYDPRYYEAGWMLQILSLSLIGTVISSSGLNCLASIGITKVQAKFNLIRAIVLFVGLPLMFNLYGIFGAVIVVAVNSYFSLPILLFEFRKQKLLSLYKEFYILGFTIIGYVAGLLIISIFT